MKINFTLLGMCLSFLIINSENLYAQCTIQNAPINSTTAYAAGFGQTFTPTCTDLLKTISVTFLPGTFVSNDAIIKVMDSSNSVLATLTGQHVESGEITYDFSSSNITLNQGTIYTFDMNRSSLSGQLSMTISVGTYAEGAFYQYDTQNNYTYWNGMFDVLFKVNLGAPLSSFDFETTENIKIYPNPVTDILNISNTEMISKIGVLTMLGQMVQSQNVYANECRLDMSSLARGTYLVKVSIDTNVQTFKVIKE